MRFKQTKPQHLSKKDGADPLNGSHGPEEVEEEGILGCEEWDGYDCVDGDLPMMSDEKPASLSIDTNQHHFNGHEVVMDLAPMLELYSKDAETTEVVDTSQEEIASSSTDKDEHIIQGRRPIFSECEESNIAVQLKQWKEQGMKYTRLDVVKMASEYAVQLGKRPKGRPLTVKWFRSFLTRHPECYIRKSRKIKTEKVEKPDKQHFNQLDSVLSTYSVKDSPHCIFSLVELPLPMLKNGQVGIPDGLGLNGGKNHQKLSFLGTVPSSMLFCGSAAGQALPPFLIYPGKSMNRSWLSGVTPGTGGAASSTGRVTSEILVSFLREHFLSQAPGRTGDTLILLLDTNVGRYLSQAVLDLGSAFKVVFVTAQNTLNPQLHPMALGCCNTFQRELCFELEKPLYASHAPAIPSSSICEFLCRLYHRNMSAENLHVTFRKAGIFPFNPSICKKRYGAAVTKPTLKAAQSSKKKSQEENNDITEENDLESTLEDDGDLQ